MATSNYRTIYRLFVIAAVWLSAGLTASAWGGNWMPEDNESFLKSLRAKDAEFDNVSVTCNFVEIKLTSTAADWAEELMRAGQEGKAAPPAPTLLKVYEKRKASTRQLTVQNAETTLDVHWNRKEIGGAGSSKSSNASGVDQNMSAIAEVRVFHTSSKPSDPNGLLSEDRMLMELSLGVGYGNRIVSIERVTADGEFAVVEATMRLWSEDKTQARLKIDDHFLIREATLLADSNGGKGDKTRFEIGTQGLTEAQKGRQIASSGKLKRTALSAMVDGKEIKMRKDDIRDHFEIRVDRIQYDLDDATYRRLVDLDRSSATHTVVDYGGSSPEPTQTGQVDALQDQCQATESHVDCGGRSRSILRHFIRVDCRKSSRRCP